METVYNAWLMSAVTWKNQGCLSFLCQISENSQCYWHLNYTGSINGVLLSAVCFCVDFYLLHLSVLLPVASYVLSSRLAAWGRVAAVTSIVLWMPRFTLVLRLFAALCYTSFSSSRGTLGYYKITRAKSRMVGLFKTFKCWRIYPLPFSTISSQIFFHFRLSLFALLK